MRGGLVGEIPDKSSVIFSVKDYSDFPDKSHELISLLGFKQGGDITQSLHFLYGSSRLKIQPYYGDFDTINMVEIKGEMPEIGKTIEKSLKKIVSDIARRGFFITDIKCGRYKNGKAIHWTQEEILNSYRDGKNPDMNENIGESYTLYDAIMQDPTEKKGQEPAMLKVDMIAPFAGRYMEITAIYLVVSESGEGFFFADNYLDSRRILGSLIGDVEKQKTKGRPFKIMKRLFSICRLGYGMYKDDNGVKYAKLLVPIIGSNISRLSSVYSDLSSIYLLLQTNKKIDKTFTFNSLQLFKDKFNVILDLEFVRKNENNLVLLINKICGSILKDKNNDEIMEEIKELQTLINDIIVKELKIYFKSKKTTIERYTDEILNWARNLVLLKKVETQYFALSKQNNSVILTSNINNF
jgi:hypothetical protein